MRRVYIASTTRSSGFFTQLLRVLLFLGLLVLGAMLSVVALAVVVMAGLGLWAFVWWKTRHLREAIRQAKQQASERETDPVPDEISPNAKASGVVIEGEVIRRGE